MKLIAGQTKIGTTIRKDNNNIIEFTVYYGNVLEPKVDGKIMHLNIDDYLETLFNFLTSEAGKDYEKPTQQDVQDAIDKMLALEKKDERTLRPKSYSADMRLNPGAENKNQNTAQTVQKQNEQNNNAVNTPIEAAPAESDAQEKTVRQTESTPTVQDTKKESGNSAGENSKPAEEKPINKHVAAYDPVTITEVDPQELEANLRAQTINNMNVDIEDDPISKELGKDTEPKKKKEKKTKKEKEEERLSKPLNLAYDRLYKELSDKKKTISRLRVTVFSLVIVLLVVSGLGAFFGFTFYKLNAKGSALMQINGQSYEIPLAQDVQIEEGEQRLYIYGVAVTNSKGEITTSVVPFGELGDALKFSIPTQNSTNSVE